MCDHKPQTLKELISNINISKQRVSVYQDFRLVSPYKNAERCREPLAVLFLRKFTFQWVY